MNKANFKCIISSICLIFGILLGLFSLFNLSYTSSLFMASIILSLSLIIIGTVSYNIHYNQLKIIGALKNRDVSILAHWFYSPKHFTILRHYLEQNKNTHLSIVILLGLLGFVLAGGIILAFPTAGLIPSVILSIFVGLFSLISYLIIYFYYRDKLHKNIEVIIGSNVIYFDGELYSLQRATCFLTDVKLHEGEEPHLQFIYSSPGISHSPMHIITLPVPPNQLEVVKHIRLHYLELIHP